MMKKIYLIGHSESLDIYKKIVNIIYGVLKDE